MSINIGPPSVEELRPRITVIGVGGAGGNAIANMIEAAIEGVDFIVANTDAQALNASIAEHRIQLGPDITRGLGAGSRPEVGRAAAEETVQEIERALDGVNMVFIAAGMGGGTGTGAAPVVAQVARELGILTVAVITKPFPFEGRKRMQIAEAGIAALREHVDSLITIPNEKLQAVLGGGTSLLDAFKAANDVLLGAVKGISDLITKGGIINVDFADVRTVMSEMGMAMMGSGSAKGENRAEEAARKAIASPLLEDIDIHGARGLLINITGDAALTLDEYYTVNNIISELAGPDANIIIGTAVDPEMGDELSVTVVATGLGTQQELRVVRGGQVPVTKAGDINYREMDRPTVERQRGAQQRPERRAAPALNTAEDLDFIDIPAFLRRQAD